MMAARSRHLVFVDSCAANRFAAMNLDPGKELDGSRFQLAYTPGLHAEYRQALDHPLVEPHIKTWLRRLIAHCIPHAPTPGKSTDDELVAMSRHHFVITLETKPPWDRAARQVGLIIWPGLEASLRAGDTLLSVLRSRAPYLDEPSL